MQYQLVATFSTDTTDDEEVIANITTVVETVLPYMVDNVDVRVTPTDGIPDWLRSQMNRLDRRRP